MITINNVDFYAKTDVLYSHGGNVALNDKLKPCGVFVPGLRGYEETVSTDELSVDDQKLIDVAAAYKVLTE